MWECGAASGGGGGWWRGGGEEWKRVLQMQSLYNWKCSRLWFEETVPRGHVAILPHTAARVTIMLVHTLATFCDQIPMDSMINGPVHTCTHIMHVINDITNELLNVLLCNKHVVHPWWENNYLRLTPRRTFPPRVKYIACYMAEHLTINKCLISPW